MNGKQTILVVDDESSIRDMVQLSLELAGFNCLQAANAREAMGQILDARPDLVLLDWMMPDTRAMNCCGACARTSTARDCRSSC